LHGRVSVKVSLIPIKKIEGPDADRGELQRHLASIVFCPAILINNPSLEYEALRPRTLRVRDRRGQTGATVDLDVSEEGLRIGCRADRPRLIGRQAVLTPWSATAAKFPRSTDYESPSSSKSAGSFPKARVERSAPQNFTRTMNSNCRGRPVPVLGEALLSLLLL